MCKQKKGGEDMEKIEYVRELLKVDEHRERAIRCLEEFMYHQEQAMEKLGHLQKDFKRWSEEQKNSTA